MRKIKVVLIISRLNIGGPSKLINLLLKHLPKEEFDIFLITGYPPKEEGEILPDIPSSQFAYLEGLSQNKTITETFRAFREIQIFLKEFKPDIVHTHQAKAGLIGRIAAYTSNTPQIIHTFHGHVFKGYFHPFKTKMIIILEKILSSISTKIIAISPEIQKDITQKFNIAASHKIILQNIGIDFDPNILNISIENHIKEKRIIGFFGRLAPIKNPSLFVDVAKILASRNQAFLFKIFGDGPLKNEIQLKIKDLQLDGVIQMMGWSKSPKEDIGEMDALLLTSKNEGTPLSALEAMALKTPVISTDVGGIKDIIHDQNNGLLCSHDPIEIADQISSLFANDSIRHGIIENAYSYVNANYSLNNFIKTTQEIYLREKDDI